MNEVPARGPRHPAGGDQAGREAIGQDAPEPGPSHSAAPAPQPAAFVLRRPAVPGGPLIFASPHSGQDYAPDFLAATRLDARTLRRSEDSFVDELFAAAPAHGAPLLAARFPRAYCDVNREAWELDPAMFEDPLPAWVNTTSLRVAGGLGTIARVVSSGEAIYRGKLRFADAEARVRQCWQPYHDMLTRLISGTRQRNGACLLVDCHSMPAHAWDGRRGVPDFVLGDAHGTACSQEVTRLVEHELSRSGYYVRRNDPYAGGYVTRHYGRPRDGVQVLQVEIARRLYMDEDRIEKSPRFELLQSEITELIARLADAAPRLLGLG